jgi:hypothetical protein
MTSEHEERSICGKGTPRLTRVIENVFFVVKFDTSTALTKMKMVMGN